jgi:hypothetical protein
MQCGECQSPPPGVLRMVWITEGGTAFHLRPDCEALLAGQDRAERRGQPTHEPENVAYTTARADGRGACLHCFPELIPTDAKPCWVRVDDRWTRGWLLEWFKRDQQWKGKVVYIDMDQGVQVTTIKNASDLKGRASDTKDPGRAGG